MARDENRQAVITSAVVITVTNRRGKKQAGVVIYCCISTPVFIVSIQKVLKIRDSGQ
jgi:hypothetical protein